MPQGRSLPMLGCREMFLVEKGAVNQKRMKNTVLDLHYFMHGRNVCFNLHKFKKWEE